MDSPQKLQNVLLQKLMTSNLWREKKLELHWKILIYQRLGLPIFL